MRRAVRQGCSIRHYFWGRPAPKIWEGKKCLKFSAILDNYRLRSRISPEEIHISKIGKVIDQVQPLPRWVKNRLWTLVHKQKSYRRSCWPTQIEFFDRLYFGPYGVLAPQNFTRARNWPRLATAHPGRPHVGLCPIFLVYLWILSPILHFRKRRWTLVHKQKSYRRSFWPTQIALLGKLYFGTNGVLAPHIFTRARNWPRLATAHPGRPHVGLCPIFLVYFLYSSLSFVKVADNWIKICTLA